jgi:hypothetical protein
LAEFGVLHFEVCDLFAAFSDLRHVQQFHQTVCLHLRAFALFQFNIRTLRLCCFKNLLTSICLCSFAGQTFFGLHPFCDHTISAFATQYKNTNLARDWTGKFG